MLNFYSAFVIYTHKYQTIWKKKFTNGKITLQA